MAIKWTVSHLRSADYGRGLTLVKADREAALHRRGRKRPAFAIYRKLFDLTRLTTSLSQTDTRLAGRPHDATCLRPCVWTYRYGRIERGRC